MLELEGQNLRSILDIDGKNIFNMIIEALEDTYNSHAWVHYVWWEPGSFYPVPKSSCHFRVSTPQGEDLIVGGGMNYPLEEKEGDYEPDSQPGYYIQEEKLVLYRMLKENNR